MIRLFVFLALIVTMITTTVGQQPLFEPRLSHARSLEQSRILPRSPLAAPDSLRVLAVMIAFQEDADSRSNGTGSFDVSIPTRKLIDPPPHNKSYFEAHLLFARNYFEKSSNRKLVLTGSVLDSVYRLPNQMRYYSPPRNSADNRELGLLVQDSWRLVDSLTPGIPFENYDAFIIFHAGAGRDIDLASILGANPTPFDIPSLYLNLAGMQRIFGASYAGIPVRGGTYHITSSMILPETESREVPTIAGTALLQLGTNGIIAASIGSHLGLPDLFDTKTGRSGIGRFGLMDGQSIFSWNGVFPPEPSAWEKYFLGWVEPITLTRGDSTYPLPAVTLTNQPDTVYRLLMSETEYFLIENRNRDANRDGAVITRIVEGDTVVSRFANDQRGFDMFDQDSIYGVVIDVDEFDWSLPGGVNSRTGEFFDGGTLIWHIDETVIDANYATLNVNANPDRRGVDLEEADGSQDIGQNYGSFNTGSGSEAGTALDFWYDGNRAPLRIESNTFSPTSHPNSLSNGFANSHITLSEFSPRSPRMTVRIQVGDAQISMMPGFPKHTKGPVSSSVAVIQQGSGIVSGIAFAIENHSLAGPSVLYGWDFDGSPLLDGGNPDGRLLNSSATSSSFSRFAGKPAFGNFNGDPALDLMIGEKDNLGEVSRVDGYTLTDLDANGLADTLFRTAVIEKPTTAASLGPIFHVIGAANNTVHFFGVDGAFISSTRINVSDSIDIIGVSLLDSSTVIAMSASGSMELLPDPRILTPFPPALRRFGTSPAGPAVAGTISAAIGKGIAVGTKNGAIYLLDKTLNDLPGFPVLTDGSIHNSPALADIDGDGSRDIVFFSGNKIWAINASGALLLNFPIRLQTDKPILAAPIVADIDGNGTVDIVAVTQEGLIVAYDKWGKMASGFPLLGGINSGSTPAAFYMPSPCLSCVDLGLAAASDDGTIYVWKTGSLGVGPGNPPVQPWPQLMHDAQNSGLDAMMPTGVPSPGEFFPKALAYNWPNPVGPEHGFKTHIRYFVAQDATVNVKVFDLSGDLVTSFENIIARGGLENEFEWDVSNIQSGIYFARIEASGAGQSGSAVIKIAIVK